MTITIKRYGISITVTLVTQNPRVGSDLYTTEDQLSFSLLDKIYSST